MLVAGCWLFEFVEAAEADTGAEDNQAAAAATITKTADGLNVTPKVYRWTGRNLYCQR